MQPDVAARICALRPSVEDLIINGVGNPEGITEPGHQDEQVIQIKFPFSILHYIMVFYWVKVLYKWK